MGSKKYAVFPQTILSRTDGQRHYISAQQLMRLYNVDPAECIIVQTLDFQKGLNLDGLIFLKPRYDGNYSLKEPEKQNDQ